MSRRHRRRVNASRPGSVRELLALPALLRVRWPCILAVMAVATVLYAGTLLTASPMPPSQVPAQLDAATHPPGG
ncbi:hypothetical protein F7Q99_28905 [Streptomyces kaniharaensis]|uniref:Uncharacterized protein n=1 Tax=Streptomyces kaniharaensis TaxID=212423 RepID=A0A6N7KXD0_9ACTN|nr:hypothetical protein [Streptomyces kaniharaensis]MQS16141.1 hypothetical protein [Streptomyces kaniharaensis]